MHGPSSENRASNHLDSPETALLSRNTIYNHGAPTRRLLLQASAQYFSLSDLDLACARWFFLVRQSVLPLIRPCRCGGDSGAGPCAA